MPRERSGGAGGRAAIRTRDPLTAAASCVNTEPHGSVSQIDRAFAALADPTRRAILNDSAAATRPSRSSRSRSGSRSRLQEARAGPRGGRARQHREGGTGAPVQPRPAPPRRAPDGSRCTAGCWTSASTGSGSCSNEPKETHDDQPPAARTVRHDHDPNDREIHIERVFDAPRDRVFAVYTDPALIPEWWGPRGTTTIVDKMDVRSGGDWRFVARDSDGSETAFRGSYREVSAARAHRADLRVGGHAGVRLPRDRGVRGSGRPHEGHHDVALLHDRGARRDARLGMEHGLNETYARLDELLERLAARTDPRRSRRLTVGPLAARCSYDVVWAMTSSPQRPSGPHAARGPGALPDAPWSCGRGGARARGAAGSEAAVAELFARHWSPAYRAALLVTGDRAAAEDIAQEAFLAALRALPSFDARRPLRPWLHRIVVNRAIDFARARALRNEVGAERGRRAGGARRGRSPGRRRRRRRRAPRARPRAARGRRAALPARVHAGRDRRDPRPAARHRQLAPAPRPRRARRHDRRGAAAMNERELRDALRDAAPDDEAARRRAWQVVQAAYAEHEPHRRRRARGDASSRSCWRRRSCRSPPRAPPRRARPTAPSGSGCATCSASASTTPAGARRRPGRRPAARAGRRRDLGRVGRRGQAPPRRLRGGGVVAQRPLRRRLAGPRADGARPRRRGALVAARPEPVALARWAPVDGFRVAYLAGSELRVVNGDGTADRRLAAAARPASRRRGDRTPRTCSPTWTRAGGSPSWPPTRASACGAASR